MSLVRRLNSGPLVMFIVDNKLLQMRVCQEYLHQDYSVIFSSYNLMFVFVTIRQSIDMGVMDERMVAISPGELLGPEITVH